MQTLTRIFGSERWGRLRAEIHHASNSLAVYWDSGEVTEFPAIVLRMLGTGRNDLDRTNTGPDPGVRLLLVRPFGIDGVRVHFSDGHPPLHIGWVGLKQLADNGLSSHGIIK